MELSRVGDMQQRRHRNSPHRVRRPPRAKERSRKSPQVFPGAQGSLRHQSREQGGAQPAGPHSHCCSCVQQLDVVVFSFLSRRKGGRSADFLWQPGHDRPLTHLGRHQPLRDRPGSPTSSRSWKQGSLWQPLARMLSGGVPSRRHPHSVATALLLGLVTRIEERLEWPLGCKFSKNGL